MRTQLLDIIPYRADPLSGHQVSPAERLEQTVIAAVRAEELGYDAVGVGERHAGPFLSSSPTVVLAAIAQATRTVRLTTGVTVLSVLDPVRVAEDYATIDQLSRGRLDLVIGKGNEAAQFPLFGLELDDQWELLEEKYALLRVLWEQESVTWPGGPFTRPLNDVTTLPRPHGGRPRVWHGSATTLFSASLAARHGDPLFSANAIQPLENYGVLVDHYRSEHARHGHDPRTAFVGAGAGALFIADTREEAIAQYGPVYEAIVQATNVPGNNTPFRDIRHAVAEGPALVGTAADVIDKIARFHDRLGHSLQSISLPTTLPFPQQLEILERFALEVAPALRRSFPTHLWTDDDPGAGRATVPENPAWGTPGEVVPAVGATASAAPSTAGATL